MSGEVREAERPEDWPARPLREDAAAFLDLWELQVSERARNGPPPGDGAG
ncbi:MAG: hypothetical protein ACE37J_00890 [Pikeienuella sp.]